MKKPILYLLMVLSSFAAHGQAGSVLLFGDIGFSSNNDIVKTNDESFIANLGLGYQINDHITIGIEGGYSSISRRIVNSPRLSDKSWYIGPFGRYTVPVSNIFSIFGQLAMGYQNSFSSSDGTRISNTNANGFFASFFPAVGINVINGFCLNVSFGGIRWNWLDYSGGQDNPSGFTINFGQTLNIGISKNFGGVVHKKAATGME
jgi:Outer membrane protein beta-barrel domain